MQDLVILLIAAILLGLALAWLNLQSGSVWLNFITIMGSLACFSVAGLTLYKMTQGVL